MKPRTDLALKEWAVVVDALLDGTQMVILRKGGIAEDPKGPFAVEDKEFWLYPTFTHQAEDSVIPSRRGDLQVALAHKPAPGTLILPGYAEVVETVPLHSPDEMARLAGHHIWSPSYLKMRWDWKPDRPIWAIVMKVSRLATPVVLEEKAEYGGCKSWVRLSEPAPTASLTPALDEKTFNARVHALGRVLHPDRVSAV